MLAEKIHLEADEKILMLVRKHWFILYSHFFGLILAALFPLLIMIVVQTLLGLDDFEFAITFEVFSAPVIFMYTAWLLVVWMVLFGVWTNYYLDVWTITNKRLIVVDQRGLFHRTIGSFRLERLQDINVEIKGIIPTFLNFGTLHLETASNSDHEFRATGLPSPQELKALILASADSLMKNHRDATLN